MRRAVKHLVERTLVASGIATLFRRRTSGGILILAYHNVVADDDPTVGDLANHLPLSSFVKQLDLLRGTHDVVPLTDALAPARRGSRPRVAITFDDAYCGTLTHAIPALVQRGLPATVFAAPAFIGGHSFWWDALALPNGGGLPPALRERALGEWRGIDSTVREGATELGFAPRGVPAFACAATEAQLIATAALPGISVGSHTWGHPNLLRLDEQELRRELSEPMQWLRRRIPGVLPWIAYPYGFFDDRVESAARDAGYDAALAVSGGWLTSQPASRFALPRLNIPRGLSENGFVLRGAGLFCG